MIASSSTSSSTTSEFLDYSTILKAAMAISVQIDMEKLLVKMLEIMMENAGAGRGFLIMSGKGGPVLRAGTDSRGKVVSFNSMLIEGTEEFSEIVVNYVFRTGENVIIHDAYLDEPIFEGSLYRKRRDLNPFCACL